MSTRNVSRKMWGVLAVVVLSRDFVDVGKEMLHPQLVGRPDRGALEQRPHAFDGVD